MPLAPQLVDETAVVVDARRCSPGPLPGRLDARPRDREPVGAEAEAAHQRDVARRSAGTGRPRARRSSRRGSSRTAPRTCPTPTARARPRSAEPSTWYALVAAPQVYPSGNAIGSAGGVQAVGVADGRGRRRRRHGRRARRAGGQRRGQRAAAAATSSVRRVRPAGGGGVRASSPSVSDSQRRAWERSHRWSENSGCRRPGAQFPGMISQPERPHRAGVTEPVDSAQRHRSGHHRGVFGRTGPRSSLEPNGAGPSQPQ